MAKLNNAWNVVNKLIETGEDKTLLYDIYYKISNAIFKYRINEELSQQELAKKLGITQAMVSKLESGVYNYTIEQLWKIAIKLGFEFDIMFQKQNRLATNTTVQNRFLWHVEGKRLEDIKTNEPICVPENVIKVA